jgi:hypothetical protein
MPKKEMDYNKTIMYKIVCNDLQIKNCYVGHTTNFKQRKALHKSDCNNPISKGYNNEKYKFIRENGDWNNWSMIQIEVYKCDNKREAEERERYWIETLEANLNCRIPFKTKEEKKEHISAYCKEYYDENKNHKKQYYEENKEQKLEYHKEYYKKNKEQRNQYYEKNKAKILENQRQYRLNKKSATNIDNEEKI